MTVYSIYRGIAFRSQKIKMILNVNNSAGVLAALPISRVTAPAVCAKTGGSSDLTVGSATGLISSTNGLGSNVTENILGTITGADGCVIPFDYTFIGQFNATIPTYAFANNTPIIIEGDSNTSPSFGDPSFRWVEIGVTLSGGRVRVGAGCYPANPGSTIEFTVGGSAANANSMIARGSTDIAAAVAAANGQPWLYIHMIGTNMDGNLTQAITDLGVLYGQIRAAGGKILGVQCFYHNGQSSNANLDTLNAWVAANADYTFSPKNATPPIIDSNNGDHIDAGQHQALGKQLAQWINANVAPGEPYANTGQTGILTGGFGSSFVAPTTSESNSGFSGLKPTGWSLASSVASGSKPNVTLSQTTQNGKPALGVSIDASASTAASTITISLPITANLAQGALVDAYLRVALNSSTDTSSSANGTVPYVGINCEGRWPTPLQAAEDLDIVTMAGPNIFRTIPVPVASAKTSTTYQIQIIARPGTRLSLTLSEPEARLFSNVASGTAPAPLTAPSNAIFVQGQPLSYTAGTYSGSPTPTITTQYYINNVAVASSYIPQAGDVGLSCFVSETADNQYGTANQTTPTLTVLPSSVTASANISLNPLTMLSSASTGTPPVTGNANVTFAGLTVSSSASVTSVATTFDSSLTASGQLTYSNNNKTVSAASTINGIRFARSLIGKPNSDTGKYYWEILIGSNASRIGVGDSTVGNNAGGTNGTNTVYWSGTTIFGGDTGNLTMMTNISTATSTVINVAIDIANKLIWFRVAGGNWNNSGTDNPASGTGGLAITNFLSNVGVTASQAYAIVALANNVAATMTGRFAAADWTGTAPSGFNELK